MTIDYLFRLPKFPIICVIDDWLVTASSEVIFERRIANVALTPNTSYHLIDSTGEDWQFNSGEMYIMPTKRRKWSKKRTYNQSRNCTQTGISYVAKDGGTSRQLGLPRGVGINYGSVNRCKGLVEGGWGFLVNVRGDNYCAIKT
jgi:hypothetical protein